MNIAQLLSIQTVKQFNVYYSCIISLPFLNLFTQKVIFNAIVFGCSTLFLLPQE